MGGRRELIWGYASVVIPVAGDYHQFKRLDFICQPLQQQQILSARPVQIFQENEQSFRLALEKMLDNSQKTFLAVGGREFDSGWNRPFQDALDAGDDSLYHARFEVSQLGAQG